MNRYIILESLNFAIYQLEVKFVLKGKTVDSVNTYRNLKNAQRLLRRKREYDKNVCLVALSMFKEYLENLIHRDDNFKDLSVEMSDKIKGVQCQIDILT